MPGVCHKSDMAALDRCSHEENIHYYCHFGFIEIMVKHMVNNIPIYICIGPLRDPKNKNKDLARIKEFCSLMKENPKYYKEQYLNIPIYSKEKYDAILSLTKILVEHGKEIKIIAVKDDLFDSEIDPFLKANLDKNFSILELSDIFAIPQKKFHAVVKKSTGLSPKQYITKLKIEKAYDEIILSRKDLQEIASDLGIDDYNYFIKIFKSYKGHTPKYFRKESEITRGQ